MPKLVISTAAREDLASIESYLESVSGSTSTAEAFVDKIIAKCENWARLPTIFGRPRPDLLPDLRSAPFGNYIVFFRYSAGAFVVVNVLHAARDLDAYFAQDDD